MDDAINNLMTVFIGQIDSAMKISEIITNHSGEDEITPDSLITGLVYRLMVSMTNDEILESIEKGQNIMDGGSSSSDDEEYDERKYDKKIIFSRKVKRNNCDCDICSKARVCLLNFHTHECSDPLADKFKNAINHACEKHKLFI